MNADQRLIELKKAYAEILLNTAKEAAVRVAASEMKAVRLEKELNDSKEQALQMLLRLKKMMDCKVLESDMTIFNQQKNIQELSEQLRDAADIICKSEETSMSQNKKIEELEAQLNEAEDIVKDLREDLKEAHTKLERFQGNKTHSNGLFDIPTKQTEVHNGNLNVSIPDLLPPIPEDNTLSTSQPIFSSLFPVSHQKNLSIMNSNLYQRNESFVGSSNISKHVIPSILLKSKGPEFCGNRRTQRVRAFEEKLMAGQLSFTDKTHNADANHDNSTKEEDGSATADTCRVEKKVAKVSVSGHRWRKFAKCKKKKISSTKDIYKRAVKVEAAHDAQPREDLSDTVPKLVENTEDNTELTPERVGSSGSIEFAENDTVGNTIDSDLALNVKKEDVPAVIIETNTSDLANETDNQLVTDKVFKYTFQRKRKRETMSSSNEVLPPADEIVSKKNTSEEPNCPPEKEKCSLIAESSRDSRRLALVAHQLISLSDKRW